jgi:hypothetical protein
LKPGAGGDAKGKGAQQPVRKLQRMHKAVFSCLVLYSVVVVVVVVVVVLCCFVLCCYFALFIFSLSYLLSICGFTFCSFSFFLFLFRSLDSLLDETTGGKAARSAKSKKDDDKDNEALRFHLPVCQIAGDGMRWMALMAFFYFTFMRQWPGGILLDFI